MPAFSYQALDASGRSQQGVLEADSPRTARGQLRDKGWVPLKLEALVSVNGGRLTGRTERSRRTGWDGHSAGWSGWWPNWNWRRLGDWRQWRQIELWPQRAFKTAALALWTRQLSSLVGAGLGLEKALQALANETESKAQSECVTRLRADIHAGHSFAKALAQYPQDFDEIYVAVVAAGEQSGHLATVLDRLADELEQNLALKNKVLGAALYPGIVSLVALLIVIFLMTYVLPQVAQVFVSSQRSLPGLTVGMMALSAFLRTSGAWLLLGLGLLGLGLRQLRQRNAVRQSMDAHWLRLPLLGRLSAHYNAARFAATLNLLCDAGVPILKALQAAAPTLHNRAMRADAIQVLNLVREGAPLGTALASQPRFPGLLSLFARLGEQSGQLPQMLQRAARQLSEDVSRRATQCATVLEPLLIVGMGGLVMLIVLAVLLPIIELNQWGALR